jgi:hypothetical protein
MSDLEGRRDPMASVPTWQLKQAHGAAKGRNVAVADELRRRGFNTKQLRDLEWEHGQGLWRQSAKNATKIRANDGRRKRKRKKGQARRGRAEQRVEAHRQAQREINLRVERGFTVVGEDFLETRDGSCPFGDGSVVPTRGRKR